MIGAPIPEAGSHLYRVVGTPAPQGSKNIGARGQLYEASKAVAPWRHAVAIQVAAQMNRAGWAPVQIAAHVTITFLLHRPSSAAKRLHPHTRPDLDKLIRSTMDALVDAGALRDDAVAVDIHARKRYAAAGSSAGAWIQISPVEDAELAASIARHPAGKHRP
jgi:crossover junction endodeoxyribonuclease RusA